MIQEQTSDSSQNPAPGEAGQGAGGSAEALAAPIDLEALPVVRTALDHDQILARLEALARRGKLPGWRARPPDGLFEVACFGEPFDRRLVATAAAAGPGTELGFRAPLLLKTPLIMGVVTALTIWPGEWLTHSMLTTYFSWYTISTWWWYIPLTVVPLVWMVPRMVRKSEAVCRQSAGEQIAAIESALGRG